MALLRFYRRPVASEAVLEKLAAAANAACPDASPIVKVDSEFVFYVDVPETGLSDAQKGRLVWLLSETFEPENFSHSSFLDDSSIPIIEVGPRMTFTSAFSTNAVSICENCGIPVTRLERFRRYRISTATGAASAAQCDAFSTVAHDRMTEFRLLEPLTSFKVTTKPDTVKTIPLLSGGRATLEALNKEMGLGLDDQDLTYLLRVFVDELKRDPTDVELFDFSQSNSEHSRHWFFRGILEIDGEQKSENLMDIVRSTLDAHPDNSIVAFADNSSAIAGFDSKVLIPTVPGESSAFTVEKRMRHLLLTAETHNFPTGVAPFPGAETGTGGRLRDSHATGRGSYPVAGTAGYCVGNLNIPDFPLPWEPPAISTTDYIKNKVAGRVSDNEGKFVYPTNIASPLKIEIDASNGASDYGNKFGEPVVLGFTRSVGFVGPDGARKEYLKPIMFTAGIGHLDDLCKGKLAGEPNMVVVKIGGPAYRIGMGGSAASSMTQGDNVEELDFNAVQRGDAEMEQKVNRVIRACCELGNANPIVSIHDQGAGGNCNVLKEIIEPLGGKIFVRNILSGDESLSVLELWGAEYQEADALLIHPQHRSLFLRLCEREKVPVAFVGFVDGSGDVSLLDGSFDIVSHDIEKNGEFTRLAFAELEQSPPVHLPLEKVLGKMPAKIFKDGRTYSPISSEFKSSLETNEGLLLTAENALLGSLGDLSIPAVLERVLRLLAVGSKRFLTNKVDRSVTGLVAQQQCVGPLQTPLSDVAVLASSYFEVHGVASSAGEQPLKTFYQPTVHSSFSSIGDLIRAHTASLGADEERKGLSFGVSRMARMSVAEAITNIGASRITALHDAKCSANWMWAPKFPGEGAALYDAATAMADFMIKTGVAVDGGKDSLSMATRVKKGDEEDLVKSPGSLVISLYAPTEDIRRVRTPDLKRAGSSLIYTRPIRRSTVKSYLESRAVAGAESVAQLPAALFRLGGSAFEQVFEILGRTETPDIDDAVAFVDFFNAIQQLYDQADSVGDVQVLSYHDVSDGGMLTAALEMAFAGNLGLQLTLPVLSASPSEPANLMDAVRVAFAEESGVLLEVPAASEAAVLAILALKDVFAVPIGRITSKNEVSVSMATLSGKSTLLDAPMTTLRDTWESLSFRLEKMQCNVACVEQEEKSLSTTSNPPYNLSFNPDAIITRDVGAVKAVIRVGLVREEGSNGDREMVAAFYHAGFEVVDITMSDLIAGRVSLSSFRGLVFPGGFSYADVLDSAKGWGGTIKFNESVAAEITEFLARPDTFSLGVCNGCQLASLLGIVPDGQIGALPPSQQPRFVHNASGRYESRFTTVRIQESNSIFFKGMEGSTMGVWVAHGEGRVHFPDASVRERVLAEGLVPMRYVDDEGKVTERYPFNPNGSEDGIAGLVSKNGRHMAVMPHPERVHRTWQWPYLPQNWHFNENEDISIDIFAGQKEYKDVKADVEVIGNAQRVPGHLKFVNSPWMKMFTNAYEWCLQNN